MPPSEALRKALQLMQEGRLQQAEAQLRRIIQREPRNADAFHVLAGTLMHAGQPGPAIFFAQRSVDLSPHNAGYLTLLACALAGQQHWDQVVDAASRAITVDPSATDAHNALGAALLALNRPADSLLPLETANRLSPGSAGPEFNLGRACLLTGDSKRAVELLSLAVAHDPGNPRTASFLASAVNYADGITPTQVRELHQRAAALIEAAAGTSKSPAPLHRIQTFDPRRALRIGLLSPDLHTHSVSFFLEPILEFADRDRLFIACYHTAPTADDVTSRLKGHAYLWREVHSLSDRAAADLIKQDQVDILIDLCGHTAGARLGIMALRPAPIGATYLGYPATTGMASIDWRIVDSITDPPGSEPHCTERLLRLDPCFLCYRPPGAPPPSAHSQGGPLVFGSFNNILKISDSTVEVWSRVLQAVPGSRLLLKAGRLEVPAISDRTLARFAAHGVDPARISLDSNKATQPEHMAVYHRVGIALDTTPYTGTTTTCDALHMGVPVITLAGDSHVARVSASLLSAVGLPELIARTPDEFVSIAAALAADAARLESLRGSLRSRLAASPLCDARGFAARFEQAMRRMWVEHGEQGSRS